MGRTDRELVIFLAGLACENPEGIAARMLKENHPLMWHRFLEHGR